MAGATSQEIASTAGVATATVYNHFRTRDDVVVALATWLAEALCERLPTEAGVATLAEDADGGGELAGSDLSALFGIDLGDGSGAPAVVAEEAPAATPKRKAAARKPTKKKAVKKKPAKPRPASKKPSGKPPAAGRKGKAVPRSPSGKGRRKPGVA